MGAMASQITSLTIVYSTVYSKEIKASKLHVTGLCVRKSLVIDEFPAQMASNAENVWSQHHDGYICLFHTEYLIRMTDKSS